MRGHTTEHEALDWATGFFKTHADELKPDGSGRRIDRLMKDAALWQYEKRVEHDAKKWDTDLSWLATNGTRRDHELLRWVAADLLERGEPLREPLRKYLVEIGRAHV